MPKSFAPNAAGFSYEETDDLGENGVLITG